VVSYFEKNINYKCFKTMPLEKYMDIRGMQSVSNLEYYTPRNNIIYESDVVLLGNER
jgi:hypothetical protein